MEYLNRYNDVFTFTKDEENNVLWEGNFRWCRMAWPNDYTEAYALYLKEEEDPVCLDDFKIKVHNYNSDTFEKYAKYVTSDRSKICMVDPSGGPYLYEGMHLGKYLDEEFQNLIIDRFEPIETGYKIITKK